MGIWSFSPNCRRVFFILTKENDQMDEKRSLASLYPQLESEWDYGKNKSNPFFGFSFF